MGGQSEIEVTVERLHGDALDAALHDCMGVIWKAYRAGILEFNHAFQPLYQKYSDPAVVRFIESMGVGLAAAVNRKGGNDGY